MKSNIRFLTWLIISLGFILYPVLGFDIKGTPIQVSGCQYLQLDILENRYLYLIHHLLAAGPVLFFGIILNMYSYRRVFVSEYLFPILILSGIFIIWDLLFTYCGIWAFDKDYYAGLLFLNLPVEEYLWFLVIPFCGMFVYRICEYHFSFNYAKESYLKYLILVVVMAIYYKGIDKLYTAESSAFCVCVILMGIIWKVPRFGIFMYSFGFMLIPMIFFNGMLTGLFTKRALVVYNLQEFSNIRILSFPLEDVSFGFGLMYGIRCLKYLLTGCLSSVYKDTQ